MLDVLRRVAGLTAEHVAVEPEVARFLLRQRVEDVARAKRAEERASIEAAGVIALSTAAVEREALAAVTVDNPVQPLGDLQDRIIPTDRLEATVRAAPERRGEAIAVMDVIGYARGLVAEIALRLRMVAVAAHLGDAPLLHQNFDPAVDVAEIARALVPFGGHRHRPLPF
jgi:hypothetical protein